MGSVMKVIETGLAGVVIIEPKVFGDNRGFFMETFQQQRYQEVAGINMAFVQDNHSRSSKGVLRGLHFQKTKPQGKLVRVVNGEVYDVVFDAVGKISRSQGKSSLKKKGTYLTVNSPTNEKTEKLVYLRELLEAGKIKPVIDRRYPLEQIAEAHRYVDKGHKKGNVVITVEHNSKT